jgi:hypothetical protein
VSDFSFEFSQMNCNGWRVVETQEIAATRAITKNAAEQSRLEELLELSKPPVPSDCVNLDYLLFTPFRYPPLDYGSRFGDTFERGIFYGSVELETAFAETATYLWLFLDGLQKLGPLERIRDQRTAFNFAVSSSNSLDLRKQTAEKELKQYCNPSNWLASQKLGKELRARDIEILRYPSTRKSDGENLAIFSPAAFAENKPVEKTNWQLTIDQDSCWFGSHDLTFEFIKEDFLLNGRIPHPAL